MRTNSSKMLARCISILGLSLPLMFCAGGAGSTEGADLGVAEEALRPPTKKLTVFAADPELGVFGMYREGTEYVFYRVAVTSSEGKLAPSASFYDREMNPIAESTSTAPAQFVASPRDDAATRAHRGLVVAAAEALDKTLIDQVFVAERSALVGFRRLLGATPRNEGALIGLVAAVTPELRAASSGNYFEGLQRDLKWTAGLGASALEGTYRRSKFHSDLLVFSDERGDMDRPDQPRIERNARLTNAAGDNVVVQLGGHLVPEGYTQGPTEEVGLSKGSIEELETHYQGLGEAFMASRVIDSAANFPAAEKQVFARMGRHLAEQLLPQRADPEQALTSSSNYKSILYLANKSVVLLGQHSATLTNFFLLSGGVWQYRGGTFYCNHGECWGDAGMNKACNTGFIVGTAWRIPPYATVPSGQTGAGTWHSCNTRYSLQSGGHVCNDDSWTQVRVMRGRSYSLNAGISCGDGSLRARAPGCNE